MRTPKRQDSDNTDLDLTIAEWFGTDVDTIDNIDLELIEIIRYNKTPPITDPADI